MLRAVGVAVSGLPRQFGLRTTRSWRVAVDALGRAPTNGGIAGGPRGYASETQRVSSTESSGTFTQLGTYLQRCGAVWADAAEVSEVVPSDKSGGFSWRVDLPPVRLEAFRQGEFLESPPFELWPMCRGRFQFFPKGDAQCQTEGMCSLWLLTSREELGTFRLRVGNVEKAGGASEFCRVEDVLRDGALEVAVQLDAEEASSTPTVVEQSLQVTGLQLVTWHLFQMPRLLRAGNLASSPPFRFHHVLLGDMYLELLPSVEHPGYCLLFFRCRVPTMQLRVELAVGTGFAKSFIAQGRSDPEADMKAGNFLQVNLEAPGVLSSEGNLSVTCTLEDVVTLPRNIRDMIPMLDERALWPKRL